MTSNVYEAGLTVAERVRMVEWLMDPQNSFLKDIKRESEWESFYDFFVEFARSVQTNRVAFAKDFVKTYQVAADNFKYCRGERYDEATHGVMHMSLLEIVKSLSADGLIHGRFAEEVKQCEATERIKPVAKNN